MRETIVSTQETDLNKGDGNEWTEETASRRLANVQQESSESKSEQHHEEDESTASASRRALLAFALASEVIVGALTAEGALISVGARGGGIDTTNTGRCRQA